MLKVTDTSKLKEFGFVEIKGFFYRGTIAIYPNGVIVKANRNGEMPYKNKNKNQLYIWREVKDLITAGIVVKVNEFITEDIK